MKNKITIPKCSTDHPGLNDDNIMQVQKELEILLLLLQKKGRKMTIQLLQGVHEGNLLITLQNKIISRFHKIYVFKQFTYNQKHTITTI
jgi:hypothetical protein